MTSPECEIGFLFVYSLTHADMFIKTGRVIMPEVKNARNKNVSTLAVDGEDARVYDIQQGGDLGCSVVFL